MRSHSLLTVCVIASSIFSIAAPTEAGEQSNYDKLKSALLEEAEELYDLDDLDDEGVEQVKRNLRSAARALDKGENKEIAKHVIDEWEDGLGTAEHTRKCPVCNYLGRHVVQNTNVRPIPPIRQAVVPIYWTVNNQAFARDNSGFLYRITPTGQAFGGPVGRLWYVGNAWFAIDHIGRRWPARPAQR